LKLKLALVAVAALLLSGCSADQEFAADGSCDGVEVVVNYADIQPATKQCINVSGSSDSAKNILASAGIAIEGTKEYGDAVICRVNDFPSASEELIVEGEEPYLETCEEMPAAFAYWGLWVKETPETDWAYAMEGIGTLQLTRGQSLGLAFSLAGAAPTPDE